MAGPRTTIRVLAIDDEAIIRIIIQDLLEEEGYDVTLAKDGFEALRLLESEPPYDIVLIDLMMPRMDGFQVMREMKRKGHTCPVIVVTAHDELGKRALTVGAAALLKKPFTIAQLKDTVEQTLRKPPARNSKIDSH